MRNSGCEHRRLRKNYPFGKKSRADKKCKDCGELITNKMIRDNKQNRRTRR